MIQITEIRSFRGFLLVLVLAFLPTTALAYTPWQWQVSLRIRKPGDAMYMPSAVAFDKKSKRYYVVDTGRDRLVSFGKGGKVIKAFTAGNRLKAPFDMVRPDNGTLWVVEKGRNSLTRIDIANKKVKPFILHDGNREVFPDRIAYAGKKLYVLDRASGEVLRLNDKLKVEKHFDCGDTVGGLSDFVMDHGSVLALDTLNKKIFRFHADGTIADTIRLGSRVDFPVSLAVGPSGFIYVLDRHVGRVLVYTPKGKFKYRFLSEGQGPQQVYFPRELRFDPWGRLCIVDEGNGRVEIFSRF